MPALQDMELLRLQSPIVRLQRQIGWRQLIILSHGHQQRRWRDMCDVRGRFILAERFNTGDQKVSWLSATGSRYPKNGPTTTNV